MRRWVTGTLILAIFGFVPNSARATTTDLSQWFLNATAFELALESGPGKRPVQNIAEPDFLGGKNSYGKQSCYVSNMSHDQLALPYFVGNWHLIRYDRKHHI